MPTSPIPLYRPVIEVPQEVWRQGPVARRPYLGTLAEPVEEIGRAARRAAQRRPGMLRGLLRGAGPNIAAGLIFGGAEWAAEWLLENVIEPYRDWTPEAPGGIGVGWSISVEIEDTSTQPPTRFVSSRTQEPSPPFSSIRRFLTAPTFRYNNPDQPGQWGIQALLDYEFGEPQFDSLLNQDYSLPRYRFIRVISFSVLGVPSTAPRGLFDPYLGEQYTPGQPWPDLVPVELPFPGPGGNPINIPGQLTPRTPLTEASPNPGFDFDFFPNPGPLTRGIPGLRLGFTPAGVIVREILADAIPALGETILDEILEEVTDGGECPDPCPELDYDRIFEETRKIVFEELDAKLPPSRPFSTKSDTFSNRNSLSIPLPPFSQRVEIRQTEIPENARIQSGGEDAPPVVYSGWLSFGAEDNPSLRVPVHYENCSFQVPEGARHLTISLYEGHRANIRIYYLSPEE